MSEVPNIDVNVLERMDDVADFVEWLHRPRSWIAVDTETTGTDVWEPGFRVRMLQFGDRDSGWAIDFEQWPGLCEEALTWCHRNRVLMVFHNALFDVLGLAREGIRLDWSLIVDTMVISAIAGYADESRALKDITTVRFGKWASAGQGILHRGMAQAGWTWATVPFGWQPYPMYGVVDTVLTSRLLEHWWPRRDLWMPHHSLEIGTMRVTQLMSERGVGVDTDYLRTQISGLKAEEAAINARLAEYGVTSAHNNDQVAQALISAGIPMTVKTAKGKISVAKDVLAEINHPLARDVIASKQVHRVWDTYLTGLLDATWGAQGRTLIHPSINPIEARTTRMSVSNPPMQQLPRDNPTARNGIVARTDDEVLVTADYGQIELRMWARLTHDEALANTLRTADATGGDFFVEVGREVYSEPGFVKADPRRTLIKNVTYGTIYGAGIPTMAASAGVSEEAMEPIAAALKGLYPSFATLGMDLVQQGVEDGMTHWFVNSPYGRVIKVRKRDEARKLPNYLDQGSSAVVLKKALLFCEAEGIGDYLMLPVHDEILLSVPKDDALEASILLKDCMDRAARDGVDTFGVEITADPSEPGERWGALAK